VSTKTRSERAKLAQDEMKRDGFSLIELLIVLAVLAVLVGLALPRLDSASFRADANVRLVRMSLQQAQRLALQQQHDVLVSFDVAGGRIRVAEDTDNNKAVGGGEPVTWRALAEGAKFTTPSAGVYGAVATPVVGSALSTIDGMPSIVMHRSGSASSNLEVYLMVTGKKADAVRGVTLIQATGRTDWFKRIGAAWKAGGM
jgi:prepilin-type N-terminal cleavage/methylation domain-containing protein